MNHTLRPFLLAGSFAAALAGAAAAQCTNPWVTMRSIAGANLTIRAIESWDPDGAGPQGAVFVVGGDFTFAGEAPAAHIAAFDPASNTWSQLGGGVNGSVRALAAMPTGELVVAGEFTAAGGTPANRIATWNGTAWSPLGSGCDGSVNALHVRANGELIAGGWFTAAGGVATNHVARWNGSAWAPLGGGSAVVLHCFATLPNGDLIAGGGPATNQWLVQRWNGTAWSNFGSPSTATAFSIVSALLALPTGEVVAGGSYLPLVPGSSLTNVARWNGSAWTAMGSVPATAVFALGQLANGEVVAGGYQQSATSPGPVVARWTGSAWSPLGSGVNGELRALRALANGTLLAGGAFGRAGVDGFTNFASWNGTTWAACGSGAAPGRDVGALLTLANGDLVASWYDHVGGVPSYHVARRSGGTWTELGRPNQTVRTMVEMPNGDLVVGGYFTSIDGVATARLARWNGVAWSDVGGGVANQWPGVSSLAVLPNGDLAVGGAFPMAGTTAVNNIARFDGTTWHAFGPGLLGTVAALCVLPNGDLVAGGDFQHDGAITWMGRVARWNGTAWQSLVNGVDGPVSDFALLPNGDLVAVGSFTWASGSQAVDIARWNGQWWSGLGSVSSNYISAVKVLPNGHLVVAGRLAGVPGTPEPNVTRWNGASWSGFGSGLDHTATALAVLHDGDVVVGGMFQTAGGVHSPYLARITTTCPATVTTTGTSCVGSGGTLALTAQSLPWLGGTFRSRATGIAPNSIALVVLGLGPLPPLPLAAVLPQGVAGCVLTVTPDVLDARLPIAGVVDWELSLAPSLQFVGFQLHHQVVALELAPSGDFLAITSTNSLALVEGWF